MYIRLNVDGTILQYPYTITDLVLSTPNVSFSPFMTNEDLALFNVFPVVSQPQPTYDYTKNFINSVESVAGAWVQKWLVEEATSEQKEERLATQWQSVRYERDELLKSSDWTQLPDVPLTEDQKAGWKSYRSQLRDVTDQPDPFNITWPSTPA